MKNGIPGTLARLLLSLSALALAVLPSCSDTEEDGIGMVWFPVEAFCEVNVIGIGWIDAETDYLPHVIQCENGGADMEALKAQAVAARSYMYYKMASSGSVQDGTGDQVYSCGRTPTAEHMAAVAATAGQVLTYSGVVICAFYVAGADPSNRSTCVATGSDSDPTNTERYVTYNEGLSGNDIEQTTLGWVDPGNHYNRGCKSQWGARCLDEGGHDYTQILRFYYGADIGIETAEGSCITPVCAESDPTCDGLDDDCDGAFDEDYVPTTCGTGACRRSSTCAGGMETCTPGDPAASDATCDGVDDDCDGETDEDCVVPPVDADADEDAVPDATPDAPADLPSDTVPDASDDGPSADVAPDGGEDEWAGLYEMGLDGGCGCTILR